MVSALHTLTKLQDSSELLSLFAFVETVAHIYYSFVDQNVQCAIDLGLFSVNAQFLPSTTVDDVVVVVARAI